jgi:hypothetical protein
VSICRNTEYTETPDYSRIQSLLEKLRTVKAPAAKRGRSSLGRASIDAMPEPERRPTARLSKGREEVIDLVDVEDEDELPPAKPAKKAKATTAKVATAKAATAKAATGSKAAASSAASQPHSTPLLLEDPLPLPARGSRRATPAFASVVEDDDSDADDSAAVGAAVDANLILRVLSGPHEGMTRTLPTVSPASKPLKGKSKRVTEVPSEMLGIGRTCEDITKAAAYLHLEHDEYVSDRYVALALRLLF